MSDTTEAAPPPKKKGKMKKILIGAVALIVLVGGGVGAGVYASGAGLIGGGGYGTYIFQGLGQTATDLVLLGTLPTIVLAFIAAMAIDTLIALTQRDNQRETKRESR